MEAHVELGTFCTDMLARNTLREFARFWFDLVRRLRVVLNVNECNWLALLQNHVNELLPYDIIKKAMKQFI